jgi:hypothetical protein
LLLSQHSPSATLAPGTYADSMDHLHAAFHGRFRLLQLRWADCF